MSDTTYTYAVAQIRALELSLLSAADIEQLVACKSQAQCLQLLAEKGWGGSEIPQEPEAILQAERQKAWQTVRELVKDDAAVLDVLSYPDLFHNLKAAVKQACTKEAVPEIYVADCAITGETMQQWLSEKDYDAFPENMRAAAREAFETLLHTGDGQLCDVIVDRAALVAIRQAGQAASEPILRDYAESTVAVADIRIAARGMKTGKNQEFLLRALAPCDAFVPENLAAAALRGTQPLCDYLESAGYGEAVQALRESPAAFERWCDNRIIETIEPQKRNSFTAGPLIAYLLGRENEIKTVRIILTGKHNGLPEAEIRERVRKMYG